MAAVIFRVVWWGCGGVWQLANFKGDSGYFPHGSVVRCVIKHQQTLSLSPSSVLHSFLSCIFLSLSSCLPFIVHSGQFVTLLLEHVFDVRFKQLIFYSLL